VPAIPKLDQFQEPHPTPLTADALRLLLAEQTALLGPCLPLPALYEEVLRAWRGRPVTTERFRKAEALLATIRQAGCLPLLGDIITDPEVTTDARWLAAALWAHARPEMTLCWPADKAPGIDDPRWIAVIMAQLPQPDPGRSHPALLERLATGTLASCGACCSVCCWPGRPSPSPLLRTPNSRPPRRRLRRPRRRP
jgi:hypothetical protein